MLSILNLLLGLSLGSIHGIVLLLGHLDVLEDVGVSSELRDELRDALNVDGTGLVLALEPKASPCPHCWHTWTPR